MERLPIAPLCLALYGGSRGFPSLVLVTPPDEGSIVVVDRVLLVHANGRKRLVVSGGLAFSPLCNSHQEEARRGALAGGGINHPHMRLGSEAAHRHYRTRCKGGRTLDNIANSRCCILKK